jgi:hypothetical protein
MCHRFRIAGDDAGNPVWKKINLFTGGAFVQRCGSPFKNAGDKNGAVRYNNKQ